LKLSRVFPLCIAMFLGSSVSWAATVTVYVCTTSLTYRVAVGPRDDNGHRMWGPFKTWGPIDMYPVTSISKEVAASAAIRTAMVDTQARERAFLDTWFPTDKRKSECFTAEEWASRGKSLPAPFVLFRAPPKPDRKPLPRPATMLPPLSAPRERFACDIVFKYKFIRASGYSDEKTFTYSASNLSGPESAAATAARREALAALKSEKGANFTITDEPAPVCRKMN
jgi:hypothetical protein